MLPRFIPDQEYDALRKSLQNSERDFLDTWYLRDENAIPPVRVLQPRQASHIGCDVIFVVVSGNDDAKSRALDNLGRVFARQGNFDKAIESWETKLPMAKSSLETTWLYHEIGRCNLELGKYRQTDHPRLTATVHFNRQVYPLLTAKMLH